MRVSTPYRLDKGGIKPLLQRSDQEPGAPIAHTHLAGGSADGPKLANLFQKADLANADGLVGNKPFSPDTG